MAYGLHRLWLQIADWRLDCRRVTDILSTVVSLVGVWLGSLTKLHRSPYVVEGAGVTSDALPKLRRTRGFITMVLNVDPPHQLVVVSSLLSLG